MWLPGKWPSVALAIGVEPWFTALPAARGGTVLMANRRKASNKLQATIIPRPLRQMYSMAIGPPFAKAGFPVPTLLGASGVPFAPHDKRRCPVHRAERFFFRGALSECRNLTFPTMF